MPDMTPMSLTAVVAPRSIGKIIKNEKMTSVFLKEEKICYKTLSRRLWFSKIG